MRLVLYLYPSNSANSYLFGAPNELETIQRLGRLRWVRWIGKSAGVTLSTHQIETLECGAESVSPLTMDRQSATTSLSVEGEVV